MRLWLIGLLSRSSTINTTASTTSTLFGLLTVFSLTTSASTAAATNLAITRSAIAYTGALLLSTTPSALASTAPSLAQRHFCLARPAASLNHLSTMTTTTPIPTLPPQTDTFPGFSSHPALNPTPETTQLIRDAMDLFGAKPSPTIFARWSPHAVFADPICHAEGHRQYLAQWYGMPAAFAKSETLEWKLIKQQEDGIEYVQKQRYRVKGLGVTKDMISTVVMQRDPTTNKITKFEDRWNHKPLGGVFSWPFRRFNALSLPLLVGVPKETKLAVEGKS